MDEGVEPPIVAVMCHPHPQYGGTMHNKVVHRTAATLHQLGVAVLRFNFRGVGASEGRFDNGPGEIEDARASLAFASARFPSARRWLAGFSFGAWVAARLAVQDDGVERLILIAPGVTRSDFGFLRDSTVPKLVVQGTDDVVCPLAALEAAFAGWAEPKTLVRVEGATHFFDRKLGELAKALSGALGAPGQNTPSQTT